MSAHNLTMGGVVLPSTVRIIWPEESATCAQIARQRAEARADWLLLKRVRKLLGLKRGESLTAAVEELIRTSKAGSPRARPTRSPVRQSRSQSPIRLESAGAWAELRKRPAKRKAR